MCKRILFASPKKEGRASCEPPFAGNLVLYARLLRKPIEVLLHRLNTSSRLSTSCFLARRRFLGPQSSSELCENSFHALSTFNFHRENSSRTRSLHFLIQNIDGLEYRILMVIRLIKGGFTRDVVQPTVGGNGRRVSTKKTGRKCAVKYCGATFNSHSDFSRKQSFL